MSVLAGFVDWSVSGRPINQLSGMFRPFRQHFANGFQNIDRRFCALGVSRPVAGSSLRSTGVCEDGSVCAVVDGRLDRLTDLRRSFGLDGEASDAQVVVAAYRGLGTECFRRFRGDFAIIIWDAVAGLLVAARDSFAVRPLCYAFSGGRIALASDPEQILASGLVSRDTDDEMVLDYLLWDARSVDRTFFREIRALPGGNLLVVNRTGARITGFRPDALATLNLPSRKAYEDEYRGRFRAAVATCIESDSPVVAELSGGLDSSSIVCMADRILAEDPSLCPSLVAAAGLYPGLACDEEPFVRAVERHVSLPVDCWDATDVSINELDPSSIALPGGRFATFGGTEGQLHIARSRNAKVLISGFGGDQVGTPTGGLRDAVTERRWSDAAKMVFGRPELEATTILATLWALARSFTPSPVRQAGVLLRSNEGRPIWLSEWAKRHPRPRAAAERLEGLGSEIHRRMWRSLTSGPHALVMAFSQHHAIRSGLDLRFPFLDLDLVSVALSLPSRFWPPAWPYERLHREILRDLLPAEIVQRRSKAKFSPAVALRVRRHLPIIRELFSGAGWKSARFVERQAAQQLLDDFVSGKTTIFSVTYAVWAIATLEAWLRAISEYPTSRPLEVT